MEERELKLEISDAIFELSQVGFDPVYGARPLKRAIQQLVENPLAQAILEGSSVLETGLCGARWLLTEVRERGHDR